MLLVLAVTASADAAPRRAHGTHGTVRRLCADARVERWPGGLLVGIIRRGEDMRRYSFRGHWALGVGEDGARYRGYVQTRLFCRPSAAGLRALERDRAATGLAGHTSSKILPSALPRRTCTEYVWLRDRPLDRAIGILWLGDVFVAHRSARNPYFGGDARGHEMRRGWVPRSAFCHKLPSAPAGFATMTTASGAALLTPPTSLGCEDGAPRRGLIEVGVDFAKRAGVAIRADLVRDGRILRGPVFQPGQPDSLARGAVGPFRCGATAHVVYRRMDGAQAVLSSTEVTVGGRVASARAAAVRAPGTSCSARPTLVYAHGHEGPVSHRYDARPAVSRDGGAVAFDTPLALVPADRDGTRDVYLRTSGGLRLISRRPGGGSAGATSRAPAISADGSRVAFESDASDLVAGDDNHARDVFFSDAGGSPRLVSAAPSGHPGNGRSRAPSLSGDGTLVAFESRATDLVDSAPPEGIYVARLTGDGTPSIRLAVADAYRPALSADGTVLVFETDRAYSPADRNRDVDVYVLRIADHEIKLVSATPAGAAAGGRSLAGVPSSDGRLIAFMSAASDVVKGDIGGVRDVFRRDMRSGVTVLVSRDRCGGFANGYSRYPSISASGRFVAFDSHAGDLIARSTAGEGEVYLRDVSRGATRLMSTRPDGRPSSRTAFSPALSGDGSLVAFPSFGSDLVAGDRNGKVDQFSRRRDESRVRKVS